MNYRLEIDGLRAIAVVSVILYHAQIVTFGRTWFEGGFIGVDIFFVISGYLITRIILIELEETNTFSFIKFYERRARRILPMLFLVIAVCIPFAWQKLIPMDLVDFSKSALSAMGFGSNFFFYYASTEYGAESAFLKPLLHTWSLGVEEQFYIVIPIIILLIWKFARTSLLILLIGMMLMSVQFADVMKVSNSELNFFLPFSRFWELLVGSVLAFIELKYGRTKKSLLTQTLPIFGLSLIVYSVLFFSSNTPHPNFHTLIPILGVALILAFCSTEDFVGKLLSFKPMVGVGLISYSLYLWHFPIFAFLRYNSFGTSIYEKSIYEKIFWSLAILVLSICSYFLIEKPSRNRKIVKGKLFFSALLISIFALTYVNYDFILKEGYKDRLPPILSKLNLNEEVWHIFKQNGDRCYDRKSDFCRIESDKDLTYIHALGDSHFSSMSKQLVSKLGTDFNYLESNAGGCPFALNINLYTNNGNLHQICTSKYQSLRFQALSQNPSIILIGGRFTLYLSGKRIEKGDGGLKRDKLKSFRSENKTSFEEEFTNTIELLISKGHKVVFVYPIPEVNVHVPKYIYKSIKGNKDILEVKSEFKPLTTSFEVYKERSTSTFELFDSIKSSSIYRVYPHTLFCDKQIKGRCVTHDNDDIFYADDDHPSAKGSEMIVDLIMEQIEKAEVNIRK